MMNQPEVWAYWGHEPSYHLRRMHSAPSLFAPGECTDEWLDRLRSEESIRTAAEAGINIIFTSFYKGFGLAHEKEEMQKTKEVVEIAHKYNMKVLGYCQLESIYYETFLGEDPQAADMASRTHDGKIAIWGTAYYRWRVCYNSDRFWKYIQIIVDYGLNELKLDGFHFDNSYMSNCYCDNCKQDFRRYLRETVKNPDQILGINSFDHVEIPYFENLQGRIFDPLYILWLKYKQNKCAQMLDQIFAYVKEKSDNKALVLHNPAFPRVESSYINNSFNPEFSGSHCDYIMAENHENLVDDNGKITTQILAYKFAKRFHYKVFESSWRSPKETKDCADFDAYTSLNRNTYPSTYFDIAYYLSQSMIFGGIVGTTWLMRSNHNGCGMIMDDPLQLDTHRKVISYFKQHHLLYNQKEFNQLKILYDTDNLLGMGLSKSGISQLREVVNTVHNANIQFSFVTPEEIIGLEKDQVLLVPDVYFASDSLCRDVESAVHRGCRVILLGSFNICNSYGKAKDVRTRQSKIPGAVYVKMQEDWIGAIKACLQQRVEVTAPNIVSEIMKDETGNLLLHLLSTKDLPKREVEIKLNGLGELKEIELFSFEPVTAKLQGNTISLKDFRTMATLKIQR